MSSVLVISIICFLLNTDAAARSHGHRKHQSTVVVGAINCDTCFHRHFSRLITGSMVALECVGDGNNDGTAFPSFSKEVNTNKHGVFRVHLPDNIAQHVNRVKACSVKLIRSGNPFCATGSSSATSSSTLRLKSRKQGIHVYSAGLFTFRPAQRPEFCNQKPVCNSQFKVPQQIPSLLPRNPLQPQSFFPPNPFQPPSLLPPNPFQPPSLWPPNPFQPSPSILPPNPFQPTPPSILPPLPFQPSPPPFFNIPPIPGFTPSPPPPFFHIPEIPGFTPSPPPPFFHFPEIPGFTPSPPPPPPFFHFPEIPGFTPASPPPPPPFFHFPEIPGFTPASPPPPPPFFHFPEIPGFTPASPPPPPGFNFPPIRSIIPSESKPSDP